MSHAFWNCLIAQESNRWSTKEASDHPGMSAINTGYSWREISSDSSFLAVKLRQHMAAQETARNLPKKNHPQQREFCRGKQTGIQDGLFGQNVRLWQLTVVSFQYVPI